MGDIIGSSAELYTTPALVVAICHQLASHRLRDLDYDGIAHVPPAAGMKRKEPTEADTPGQPTPQAGRRQPQTSCLNCRVKKIKCDRGAPCASCTIRGIPCTGQDQAGPKPVVVPQRKTPGPGVDASVLERLARLENAVFGDAQNRGSVNGGGPTKNPPQPSPAASTLATAVDKPSPSLHQDTERQQTARFLDMTYTRDDHSATTPTCRLRFQVTPAASHPNRPAGGYGARAGRWSGPAFVMTREEAFLLLHDFFHNPYHLLPIIYEPSARSLIDVFYTQLEQGYEGDPTSAALILSIASTSASFFSPNGDTHGIFASTEEATEASLGWRETAIAILDDPQFPPNGSLERCQARTILAYVVCNIEGCSARYRLLHSCAVAVARDMSLHLIDSTATADASGDFATREIKRRLWWHLVSTDWLLSLVGGPLDGTYTIQPRHFIVNRPRNLNDSDLNTSDENFTYPLDTLTQVSCFLQRILLSEVCKEMVDARPPGLLDVEITDFNTATSLDLLFEKILTEMPPFLKKGAPIPEGAPYYFAQQRDLVLLCFYFRRARLHRPFLLHDTDNPEYEPSRRQCISSARTVLSISIEMLEGPSAVDQNQVFGNPLAYRAGLVISGMFMACAVLALNAGLIWNRSTGDGGNNARANDATTSEMHGEITRACRVLAKAGEKSTFAANLLRNLVGVLRQYSVKEIDDLVPPVVNPSSNPEDAGSHSDTSSHTYVPGSQSQLMGDSVNPADNFTMWNEFFATMPDMEGYDQLFAGLDYYCGPT
ncbi:hypothetical protein SAMD00023353_2200750 [Rosellinia necatrix]|uniref:Zn(2)-C6 fungal-type domain-containing protein n=1 Tax=Rosellinia necatrix TaxID=77044 RepID=A0A1S7UNW0_ROSNE|nr:hypothetical protein SAMD00023353_2200750 [Rosellinia necatrix]